MTDASYVLVTAARNEADHILSVIKSVISQTIPPRCWIIVSDGSTDNTEEIVRSYCEDYPFIELLHRDAEENRNFGSKARAVEAGYKQIFDTPHDFVGVLDADVSFSEDYYDNIIRHFKEDPQLGIAGGVLLDVVDGRPIPQLTSPDWSVSGPIQMFRTECWIEIGGYLPICGGIDATAEVMARMNGWKVRAFPELTVLHHRQTGKENHSTAGRYFHRGLEDHRLGYLPLFFLAKCVRYFRVRPFVIGGLIMFCGYLWGVMSRQKRAVPEAVVHYLRQEQAGRLCAIFGLRKGGAG